MEADLPLSNQPFLWTGTDPQTACLFLHGFGGGCYEMHWLAERIHRLGFTVQGFNYPGHDMPAVWMPDSTWQQWYDRIRQVYAQLRERYARIRVIGFSTGCPLGLQLATDYPVDRLVMLSPFLALRPWGGIRLEGWVQSLGGWVRYVPKLQANIKDPKVRKAAEQVQFLRSLNLTGVQSALELIEQVKPELARIRVPTLILQSTLDSVVDPAGAEWLYQALGSEDKKIYWLKNSDHLISLDQERETVFREVCSFLRVD